MNSTVDGALLNSRSDRVVFIYLLTYLFVVYLTALSVDQPA
jgi:hypothetical protein